MVIQWWVPLYMREQITERVSSEGDNSCSSASPWIFYEVMLLHENLWQDYQKFFLHLFVSWRKSSRLGVVLLDDTSMTLFVLWMGNQISFNLCFHLSNIAILRICFHSHGNSCIVATETAAAIDSLYCGNRDCSSSTLSNRITSPMYSYPFILGVSSHALLLHSHNKLCWINNVSIIELHCKSIAANKWWNSVLICSIRRESVEFGQRRNPYHIIVYHFYCTHALSEQAIQRI